jgi:hypothetical protein
MTRVNKKSRSKLLPPKIQLQIQDAATGSYPTIARTVSDNRTGKYSTFFDDNKTIVFGSYTSTLPAPYLYFKLDNSFLSASNTYTAPTSGPTGSLPFPTLTSVPMTMISGATIVNTDFAYSAGGNNSGSLLLVSASRQHTELSTSLALTGNYTAACWMKLNSDPGGSQLYTIFSKQNPDNIKNFDFACVTGNGNAFGVLIGNFSASNANNLVNVTSFDTAGFVGKWVHVGFSYTGGTSYSDVKLYINGKLQSSSNASNGVFVSPNFSGSNQIMLGDGAGFINNRTFDGYLDEFVIYDRILTNDQFFSLYGSRYDYYLAGKANAGSGLNPENEFWQENSELHTDIYVNAKPVKGVSDQFAHFTPGQYLTPFRDNLNPAANNGANPLASFYLTGSKISEVGEGFSQPLWSKSKIEIDITPTVSHSFYIQNFLSTSQNFPMAYWNTSTKKWEGVGQGKEYGNYLTASAISRFLDEQPIGFGNCVTSEGTFTLIDQSAGAKISSFGFPWHTKFHGTSSNTIAMSDYINQPFLLEKIVIDCSAAFKHNNSAGTAGASSPYEINTFFILNQRQPFSYNDPAHQVTTFLSGINPITTQTFNSAASLPSIPPGGSTRISTIRDLVTYAQVCTFTDTVNLARTSSFKQEKTILSFDPNEPLSSQTLQNEWGGRLILSGVVKNALPCDSAGFIQVGMGTYEGVFLQNNSSTRSGLNVAGGRDFIGALEKGQVISGSTYNGITTNLFNRYSKNNPYLLLPTDQLILGWQLPVPDSINQEIFAGLGDPTYNGKGSELIFYPVTSKVTLYGSLIREGKEYHDTTNQLLTSPGIHEVIE